MLVLTTSSSFAVAAMNLVFVVESDLRLLVVCALFVGATWLVFSAVVLGLVVIMNGAIRLTVHSLVVSLDIIDLLMSWME